MMLGALLVARWDAAQGVVLHTWIDDRLLPRSAALRAASRAGSPR